MCTIACVYIKTHRDTRRAWHHLETANALQYKEVASLQAQEASQVCVCVLDKYMCVSGCLIVCKDKITLQETNTSLHSLSLSLTHPHTHPPTHTHTPLRRRQHWQPSSPSMMPPQKQAPFINSCSRVWWAVRMQPQCLWWGCLVVEAHWWHK